ncbi:MAG TPA: lysophospholipase, partial [Candidatus Eisenbergiella merdipullorum]|nr:lysophospholipase [Candidatus Eisenbergiella merdipullorum]
KKREFDYPSADGKTRVHAVEWRPDGDPACILQIIHGMAEYVDRYDPFASYLAERGVLVTGHDHLGHGMSVGEDHPYGYFCHANAPDVLMEDVHTLRMYQQKRGPELPYLMLGHSMGSFILRNYLCRYKEGLAGALIMGTGMQPKRLLDLSLALVRILSILQGEKHKSGLVNALAFGSYDRKIPYPSSPMDWLSRDKKEVEKYIADPLCGFTFTLNGFQTLFTLIRRLHDTERLEGMPKQLPVRFLSGEMDPVGDYGKAVRQVYDSFLAAGMKNVSMKLYENDRHELINEADRKEVWIDLYEWIMTIVREGDSSERNGERIEKRPEHQ